MRKLRKLLAKRGIKIKCDEKLYQKLIRADILCSHTNGWFNCDTPNIIFMVKNGFRYRSLNPIRTILHEYRHWLQWHRKKAIWRTNLSTIENDADRFAKRALKYFT